MKTKNIFILPTSILILASFACQSSGPLGNFFSSPTPTATLTPTATVTFTPSPTPTVTSSPTPLPTGVHTEVLNDGSTKVVDYDNGYGFSLSEDWLPVPANAEALKTAMEKAAENDPNLVDSLESMQRVIGDDTLRLMSFNTNKELTDGTSYPNLLVVTLKDELVKSIPMDFLVELNVNQLKESGLKATVRDYGTDTNKHYLEYGYVIMDNSTKQGPRIINVRQHIIIIKVDSAMTLFTLTVPASKKESAASLAQALIDSLYLLSH